MRTFLFAILIYSIALSSCSYANKSEEQQIILASKKSIEYALSDNVSFKNYQLSSIGLYANKTSSVFRGNQDNEYHVKIMEKLKGRRYWEACFTNKNPEVVGAMYCYFIERNSLVLIADYKIK